MVWCSPLTSPSSGEGEGEGRGGEGWPKIFFSWGEIRHGLVWSGDCQLTSHNIHVNMLELCLCKGNMDLSRGEHTLVSPSQIKPWVHMGWCSPLSSDEGEGQRGGESDM